MRLVEKKCPNCGGALKFSFEDKETTCEFCGRSFEIERDEKIKEDKDEMFNAENYALTEEQKEAAKAMVAGFAGFTVVPIFIFAFAVIVMVSIGIFSARRIDKKADEPIKTQEKVDNNKKEEVVEKTTEELLKEKGYIIAFGDLSEKDIKNLRDNSLSILKERINRSDPFLYSHGGLSYVGSYLLYNPRGNYIFDVFKIVFKVNKKEVPYYMAVKYSDAKVLEGKLVLDMDGYVEGSLVSNSGQYSKDFFGYESTKSLYNKVIRGLTEENKVVVAGGVYNE